MGSYVFRWPYPAGDVHVTGTFDDWAKSEQLIKKGDIWEKEVQLPSADEKILYKFVVDDEWIVDEGAPKEDDGHYNVNNVLHPHEIKRREITSDTPGAFPETPANEQQFSVSPLPATGGILNPIQLAPGEKVPNSKDITTDNVDSNVTTSKEDYERAGQESDQQISVNPIPASSGISNPITLTPGEKIPPAGDFNPNTIDSNVTTSKEDYEKAGQEEPEQTFSVNPIPASSGISNPITLAPGEKVPPAGDYNTNTIDSNVTTSKEDYEKAGQESEQTFSVNPIPASSGISNPITLAPGEKIPPTGEFNTNTVDSNVTTSKEDYEKAGTSPFPAAAAGATAVGVGIGGAAAVSAFSKPEGKENIIPESSLPVDAPKADTLDSGPFISSVAPNSTTAQLAASVPLEQNNGQSPFISSTGPDTTTADLAAKVPLEPTGATPIVSSVAPGATTADLAADVPLERGADPTISSVAPGTTTAGLAAGVPLEDREQGSVVSPSDAPSEVVQEKADVEKELLSKVRPSEAQGEPASAADQQTSYYGLATTVPRTVEQSMAKAEVAPEAAADRSMVAEKSVVEQELLSKVSSTNEAGEPAPTIAAATAETAPAATTAVPDLTDGTTANQPIPDTDTSTATRGASAGEVAAGAGVGGAAAAGLASAAARHNDANVEPPRVTDAQKPNITTEAAPAQVKDEVVPPTSTDTPVDSTLANEPAVQYLSQNELDNSTTTAPATADKSATAAAAASGVPTITNTGTGAVTGATATEITPGVADTSAPSTPAKKTTTTATPTKKATETSAANSPASTTTTERKKKHRISGFFEKLKKKFD